jgi:hypothetical protein
LSLLSLVVLGACALDGDTEDVARSRHALDAPLPEAYCSAQVDGVGVVDTETDYLPSVVACENTGADLQALKAQAIAARSVLYWTLGTNGSICDGQGCQVYSCANQPSALIQQAVDETSGKYLAYNSNVTYAFYVNGDTMTAPSSCIGDPNAQNENWVTYNEGLSGTDVQQTNLGFVHAPSDSGYGQNRGCMSQWGGRCLEELGYDTTAILRFYYGADIEVLQAMGPCVTPDTSGSGGGGNGGSGGEVGGGAPSSGGSGGEVGGDGPSSDAAPSAGADRGGGGCQCHYVGARQQGNGWVLLLLVALSWRRRQAQAWFRS